MKIEQVAVDRLLADPANVRVHDARNLAAIKGSLARFGQQKPIVVDAKGVVRAGNGTLAAARELGWDRVAVVRTGLAGSEATAYAIADNRTAELASWDDGALAETLRSLQSEESDLAAVGFTDAEVDALIEGLGTAIVEAGDWPERAPPEKHSIVMAYRDADVAAILAFLDETDRSVLTDGRAGAKILERIREISAARTDQG